MREKNQAVILAAGMGRRLDPVIKGSPKCLTPIGGSTLIEHRVEALRQVGVERIVVVVGHEADSVRDCLGCGCEYVMNDVFEETNSLYSLWLMRERVSGPFLMTNCDVLVHRGILTRLIEHPGNALAYDSRSGDDAEHMKVEVEDGRLCAISKSLPADRTCGENVGMMKFDRDGARGLLEAADEIVSRGDVNIWAPAAVGLLAERQAVHCVDIAGYDWIEIDFPADLHEARRRVWPRVEASFREDGTGQAAVA